MLTLRWIGQNGYILNDGNKEICIDPYLSDVVNRVARRPRMISPPFSPEELKSDVVICTHNHLDHTDIDAIPLMNKDHMLFLAPKDAEKTLRDCGVSRYIPFDEGAEIKSGEFILKAVFADHTVPAVGVMVKHHALTLYFSGDTEYHKKLEAYKRYDIDVMFVCINGKLGNMNADEAVKLTNIIEPRKAVPAHYGMFESNTEDPARFTSRVQCGFEMEYNREYDVSEMLKDV